MTIAGSGPVGSRQLAASPRQELGQIVVHLRAAAPAETANTALAAGGLVSALPGDAAVKPRWPSQRKRMIIPDTRYEIGSYGAVPLS